MHAAELLRKDTEEEEKEIEVAQNKAKQKRRIKKAYKILLGVFIFITIAFRYFFYLDISNGCFITIFPSFLEFNNITVKEAIVILKNAAKKDYNDLCSNVSIINPSPNCGGYDGGCFYADRPNTIYSNISPRDPALTAAVLVHEVCHVKQFKENRPMSEDECYTKDSQILEQIVRP